VRGLVDELWGENPPRNEKAALQTLVSRVRAVCAADLVISTAGGYGLSAALDQIDLTRASEHRNRARAAHGSGDRALAEREATEGLGLWHGEVAAELGDTELGVRLATAASVVRADLFRVRAAARIDQGNHAGAAGDLEALVVLSPYDDGAQLLRMRSLAASGRRNDAIRAFAEFRNRMREDLGTDPSRELVQLNAQLLQGEEESSSAAQHVRIGLRSSPNELIGRDADVDAITELLTRSRLTTVLGVGGLGKTRLAQEIAHRAAHNVPAVIVVELASVRSGEDVPLALASTLGIGEAAATRLKRADAGDRRDVRSRILAALAEQQTLLVMDNCEHIIDAVAAWVSDILDSVASVRVLATSRAPLQIAAEHVYALEPLSSTDGAESLPPAITLFIDRARAARPSASLPVDTIARLCDRLDGLPLAIELAAARIRSMSVEEIERRIGNRFALLTSGDRTAPERHRTLLAVIDWSWNLLSESERRMLRRLSRFPDGFSAEAANIVAADTVATDTVAADTVAADTVAADTVAADTGATGPADAPDDDLESLVNQSLVSVADSSRTGSVRYRMLETVREFGEMALTSAGEDTQVTEAMYRWASAFAVESWRTTYGAQQVATFARVNEEQDNLVAVLRSAIDQRRGDVIVEVFVTLAFHWSIRGAHSEVMSFSAAVLDALSDYEPEPEQTEAAIAAWGVIAGTSLIGNTRQGLRALVRTRRLARDHVFEDAQLSMLIQLLLSISDMPKVQQVLAEHRVSDDPLVAGFANVMTAQFCENDGQIDRATQFAQTAYENATRSGDTWLTSMAAQSLAQLHSQRARPAEALKWAHAAEPALRALDAEDDLRQLDWVIAVNEISSGHPELGKVTLERLAAADAESAGFDYADLRSIGFSGLAEIAASSGDIDEARRLYARAREVFREVTQRAAPWALTVASAYVAISVRAGATNEPETMANARRLRTQILVSHRLRAKYSDRPVLGSGLLGLALWILAPDRTGATEAERDIGRELLVLSHALAGREDMPTLHWERARRETAAAYPNDDIDGALARACTLTMDERTARAIELLRDRRLQATFALQS
jgi:predicted ATPase/DNA-binding SARP family transcriptional activator